MEGPAKARVRYLAKALEWRLRDDCTKSRFFREGCEDLGRTHGLTIAIYAGRPNIFLGPVYPAMNIVGL